MPCVLLVDDDVGTLETFQVILQHQHHSVITANSGLTCLARLCDSTIDCVILDLRLGDECGLDVLRRVRHEHVTVPVVMITGFATVRSAVEATRMGVVDYIEKPVDEEKLLHAIEQAIDVQGATFTDSDVRVEMPAAKRWAHLIAGVLAARRDPSTLTDWARVVGATRGTLENRCHAASVSTKASLDFARVLRAIIYSRRLQCPPEALLEGDPRTVGRLMLMSGFAAHGTVSAQRPTVLEFIESQTFVSDRLALGAIRDEIMTRSSELPRKG